MRNSRKIRAQKLVQLCLLQVTRGIALPALFFCSALSAQPAFYESEPNNLPADLNPIAGAVQIMGSLEGDDQDGFLWTVSDVDAQKRWTLELQGIPGTLTIVEVIRLEYADNGVDVASKTTLFTIGSRDGSKPALAENLYFEPGEYVLGVASAGGGDALFRPEIESLDFGDDGKPAGGAATGTTLGGYRLAIREGKTLHLASKPPENTSLETAQKTRLGAYFGSFSAATDSWFQFDVSDQQTGQSWNLEGQVPVGRSVVAFLRGTDGNELSRTASNKMGKFVFPDLGLVAGTHFLELKAKEGGMIRAVESQSVGQRVEGAEAEPNDSWAVANRIDATGPVTGRMGKGNEIDYFTFTLDQETADDKLLLKVESDPEHPLELSILDSRGKQMQSRKAQGSVELVDLVLPPGNYGFSVGRGPEGAQYTVSLTADGKPQAGLEAEPNDTIEYASGIPSNRRVKGRFSGKDTDFYKIIVTEEPQLWRFQVIGDEIHELAYHDGAGIQNQVIRAQSNQRRVRLDNIFLLPGTHYVRVSGRGVGTYTLIARAIGPPDPNGEFEPNDDTSRMQPLRIGQIRTGLLEDKADLDNYRFYLAHWDRIRLTIEPPADGEIMASLYWDTKTFKSYNTPQTGQKVELEGLFPPGDYRLALSARKTSEASYKLGLERLERFGCPTDCEPNDNIDFASPLPADHVIEGRVNEWRDSDWYVLPVFDRPTEMIATSGQRHGVKVVDRSYAAKSMVAWDRDAQLWRGTIPAGVQTFMQVRGAREPPYRFELSFAGESEARPVPSGLPLELTLDLDSNKVGAYRHYGQQISGTIQLSNSSSSPISLNLDTAASDYRWRVELEENVITVPAGSSHAAPLMLHVPADVWADWPVRISVRALGDNGASAEAFIDIKTGRKTPPVNAVYGWTLPEALRGGFNVAWTALGGRWTGEKDTAVGHGFPYLFDGMAVRNQGLQLRGGTEVQTIDVMVELAGGEPVEVAGLALNNLAGATAQKFLRNVDFALSLDGEHFTVVVEDELLPIKAEQVFILERPVEARYARLQLKNAFDGQPRSSMVLGEFKVIARPGIDISGGKGFNLANAKLGGHVVWSRPAISASNWDGIMLLEDGMFDQKRVKPGQQLEWAIGFHHGRAAQISRLEWIDSAKTTLENKIRKVSVAVSMESPVGPWRSIGDWDLAGGSTASVFKLDQPTWARYVKFSVAGPGQQKSHALPATLRIWERATGNEYRSILAEWGFASQAAIYEELHPLRVEKPFEAAGHDSKDKASLLEFDQLASGEVVLGKHEHWYKLSVPVDDNTLTIAIGGEPTVRTVVRLQNSAGESIPARKITGVSTPALHVLEAIVEPGGDYFVKIEEPPRNVVFLWDTSASVGAYLPVIYNSLMAYMEDVVPGLDAANLIPFGGKLLLRDWYGEPYILQTVLNDYPRKESSSEAEKTLHTASKALAPRAGTKAIVMVTDAATNRYPLMWDEFERVQPRIFGLGVGSQGALGRNPAREQDLMQDWSRVNGGHYTNLLSEGQMEIAFDRASTMLRRPAEYTLEVSSTFREAPGPGSLKVIAQEGEAATSGAVMLILDASGSMLKRMGGKRRITIAKEVLIEAVNQHIPPGTQVALRVFGHKEPNSCRTDLEIALKPLDPAAATSTIERVNAMNLAKTPIADSLARIESDLKQAQGRKVVVLVTDGEETCDGDPEKVIQRLQDKGFEVSLNIVGFAIDDDELESQFQSWSELG